MILGYNTNGWSNHDPLQALELLAEMGYRSVALTVDHHWLNPYATDYSAQLRRFQGKLDQLGLETTVETGARYLLDPLRKHQPTLVSPSENERKRRIDFLCRCVDLARELNSRSVSLWSGAPLENTQPFETMLERLTEAMRPLIDHAEANSVILGFEPEPGMLIETTRQFAELKSGIPSKSFQMTLDIGHVHCTGESPIADVIRRCRDNIVNVHIEDMVRDRHEHLRFGDGEIEFAPVMETFREIDYQGPVHVELSRHSHLAPLVARESFDFLNALIHPHE